MTYRFENYGLDAIRDSDELTYNMVGYTLENGKTIVGYSGIPYVYKTMGSFELWALMDWEGDALVLDTLHTHASGPYAWTLAYSEIDLTPNDAAKLDRTWVFHDPETGEGIVPIQILGADVLPGPMMDDEVTMQVVGIPIEISYYET